MILFLSLVLLPLLYQWYMFPKCAEDVEYQGGKCAIPVRNPLNPFDRGHILIARNRIDCSTLKWSAFLGGVYMSSYLWRFIFYTCFMDETERYYYNRIGSQ
jgi:hypothetical protein